MTTMAFAASVSAGIVLLLMPAAPGLAQPVMVQHATRTIVLPNPAYTGVSPVESALRSRRSVRDFAPQSLTLAEVSQLLWAAQGITGAEQPLCILPLGRIMQPAR